MINFFYALILWKRYFVKRLNYFTTEKLRYVKILTLPSIGVRYSSFLSKLGYLPVKGRVHICSTTVVTTIKWMLIQALCLGHCLVLSVMLPWKVLNFFPCVKTNKSFCSSFWWNPSTPVRLQYFLVLHARMLRCANKIWLTREKWL